MAMPGQSDKVLVVIAPATQTVNTNATSYGYVDCIGYDHAQFIYTCVTGTATGVMAKEYAIREGTNSTAASAIVALTGGTQTATSVAWVVGSLSTDVPVISVINVDLHKRERYLRCQITPGEKNIPCVIVILSRAKIAPPAANTMVIVNNVIG